MLFFSVLYPSKFEFLLYSSPFPFQELTNPGPFPPQTLLCFISTMAHVTSYKPFELPRFYTCRLIPLSRSLQDLPRSLCSFDGMPFSQTPEMPPKPAPPVRSVLPSVCVKTSAISIRPLTELNRFNLTAYGLPSFCLRLIHLVTSMNPRLDIEWSGSLLLKQDLHLQATKRLVAHYATGLLYDQNCIIEL